MISVCFIKSLKVMKNNVHDKWTHINLIIIQQKYSYHCLLKSFQNSIYPQCKRQGDQKLATIQDICLISDRASKVLNDLGFCSDKYSITYGLEKSAHKIFYEETGYIDENSNDEEWRSDENYQGTKFQLLIANAIYNSKLGKIHLNYFSIK